MIDISKWAFENKKLIYFLIAVLIVGGAYSSYEMSKLEDPEITVKLAMVVTTYPGASAHQVELEVTDVLEKNIRSMGNIDNVESYSYNDLSLIQVELKTTVKETDVEQCWDLLRRKVANAQAQSASTSGTIFRVFAQVFMAFSSTSYKFREVACNLSFIYVIIVFAIGQVSITKRFEGDFSKKWTDG